MNISIETSESEAYPWSKPEESVSVRDDAPGLTKEEKALGAFLAAMHECGHDGAKMREAMLTSLGIAASVPVKRSRIHALSVALGNPKEVAAIVGDTVEDSLVEMAATRLTEQLRLEDIAAMKDELAKIAVAVGRSKTDGNDCDWFELAADVAALAAGIPNGWSMNRLPNSNEILIVSAPDGISVPLSPQGTGLASQLLYQLATTLMGGQTS